MSKGYLINIGHRDVDCPGARGDMIPTTEDSATFHNSTAALPPGKRSEAIGQLYERIPFAGKIEPLEPLPGQVPCVDIIKRALPGLEFVTGVLGGVCQRARAEGQPHTGYDELFLWLNIAGVSTVRRDGEELTGRNGHAFLATRGRTGFAILSPNPVRFLGMRLPRAALVALIGDLDTGPLRALPGDTAALRLLTRYVAGLASDPRSIDPVTARAFVRHVHDLIALTIGPTPDGAMIAERRGLRAARLHHIKSDVRANLRDCELTITAVAERHGISSRYVHKLFESAGVTFAEFLRRERLALAYRMLIDPRLAHRSISSVAYEAGFGDLSNFNHLFRRRYGARPSDIRNGR